MLSTGTTLGREARDDRTRYTVALALGLRQGEALGLRWRDVDLEGRTLSVCHALQRLGPGWALVEPKTAKSRRILPPPDVTARTLRARQLEERLLAGERWQEHEFVFASAAGTPLDGSHTTRRFHDLRHSCATFLLVQGVPDRFVMEVLGHSQIALTALPARPAASHALRAQHHGRRLRDAAGRGRRRVVRTGARAPRAGLVSGLVSPRPRRGLGHSATARGSGGGPPGMPYVV